MTRGPWDEVENKTLQFLGLAKFVVKLPAAFHYICFDKATSLRLNESNLKITFRLFSCYSEVHDRRIIICTKNSSISQLEMYFEVWSNGKFH